MLFLHTKTWKQVCSWDYRNICSPYLWWNLIQWDEVDCYVNHFMSCTIRFLCCTRSYTTFEIFMAMISNCTVAHVWKNNKTNARECNIRGTSTKTVDVRVRANDFINIRWLRVMFDYMYGFDLIIQMIIFCRGKLLENIKPFGNLSFISISLE